MHRDEAASLRQQAAACRSLATTSTDQHAARMLQDLADELDRRAFALDVESVRERESRSVCN
jgi:hypothetical protein